MCVSVSVSVSGRNRGEQIQNEGKNAGHELLIKLNPSSHSPGSHGSRYPIPHGTDKWAPSHQACHKLTSEYSSTMHAREEPTQQGSLSGPSGFGTMEPWSRATLALSGFVHGPIMSETR